MAVGSFENQMNEIVAAFERTLRQGAARGLQKALAHIATKAGELASKDQPKKALHRTSRYGSEMYRGTTRATNGAPMRLLSGDNMRQYETEMGAVAYEQVLGLGFGEVEGRVGTNVLSTPRGHENVDNPYKRKVKPKGRNKSFPYSAYHEGDKSLGAQAGNHPVLTPVVEQELATIGDLIIGGIA